MKEKILKLREEGKSFREIEKELGCSKGTISYHCSDGQKKKTKDRTQKKRDSHPIHKKLDSYKSRKSLKNRIEKFQMRVPLGEDRIDSKIPSMKDAIFTFSKNDVLDKFGEHPTCYLTGRKIDWNDGDSYTFDHIIPVSKGGDNSIENLGLCHPAANSAKGQLTVEEFVLLCKEVIEYMGV